MQDIVFGWPSKKGILLSVSKWNNPGWQSGKKTQVYSTFVIHKFTFNINEFFKKKTCNSFDSHQYHRFLIYTQFSRLYICGERHQRLSKHIIVPSGGLITQRLPFCVVLPSRQTCSDRLCPWASRQTCCSDRLCPWAPVACWQNLVACNTLQSTDIFINWKYIPPLCFS